tara:strand:- start:25 stop:1362 length:1338 start_codon:yes stop_codon:yes gene_type:complete
VKISIIGTGYVGLVSGVCLASKGNEVICVDYDSQKIESINKGISPIHEDGLEELLEKYIGNGFECTTDIQFAITNTDVTIIAVGTPFLNGEINLEQVKNAAEEIGSCIKHKNSFHTVIVKSTVVPGTTDNLVKESLESSSGKKCDDLFGLGMNPEFLREGMAVSDFMKPDRLVFGGTSCKVHSVMEEIYSEFSDIDIIRTSNNSAEMIKYTSNSLLATLISFSNEIGNLCENLMGVDSEDIFKAVHLDKRLSPILASGDRIIPEINTYLRSGCGFGGSCFPKDVNALIAFGRNKGLQMSLLNSVIEINNLQPEKLISKLKKSYKSLDGLNITILGLAFKPGTDDIRESPSLAVIKKLLQEKVVMNAYDPIAMNNAKKEFNQEEVKFSNNMRDAVFHADVILVLTAWEEFKDLDIVLKENGLNPLVLDGRRFLNKTKFNKFEAVGM